MILVISNEKDTTADFMEEIFLEKKIPYFRLDANTFPYAYDFNIECNSGVCSAYIASEAKKVYTSEVSSIWWRRPEKIGFGFAEMVVNTEVRSFIKDQANDAFDNFCAALRENSSIKWVNKPENIKSANSKISQLKFASEVGIKIPPTIYSNLSTQLCEFHKRENYDSVIKVNKRSTFVLNNSTYGHFTSKVKEEDFEDALSIRATAVYLQRRIEKLFEVRVTVIGDHVFAARIESQDYESGMNDWRQIPDRPKLWSSYKLDHKLKEKCQLLIKKLGLVFGAIDMAIDKNGEPVFFEVNPNGQWAWIEMDTGLKISDGFVDVLTCGRP